MIIINAYQNVAPPPASFTNTSDGIVFLKGTSGSPVVGDLITLDHSLNNGFNKVLKEVRYSWKRDAVEVSTNPNYGITNDDVGVVLTVDCEAEDYDGNISNSISETVDVSTLTTDASLDAHPYVGQGSNRTLVWQADVTHGSLRPVWDLSGTKPMHIMDDFGRPQGLTFANESNSPSMTGGVISGGGSARGTFLRPALTSNTKWMLFIGTKFQGSIATLSTGLGSAITIQGNGRVDVSGIGSSSIGNHVSGEEGVVMLRGNPAGINGGVSSPLGNFQAGSRSGSIDSVNAGGSVAFQINTDANLGVDKSFGSTAYMGIPNIELTGMTLYDTEVLLTSGEYVRALREYYRLEV